MTASINISRRDEVLRPRSVNEICGDLEIEIVATAVRRGPGQSCAVKTMQRILDEFGEGHLIIVLRSVVETGNNKRELVAPVLWAISDLVRSQPAWVATGLPWLEAFDQIDLGDLHVRAKANRKAVAPRKAIATMLFESLRPVFHPDNQRRMI